ncbi:MAG TPA: type II toxin-antitoxin system VapC family toxin [Polyangia bacterium]
MLVLDTHAWIWLTSDPDRLSAAARRALRKDRRAAIAAISCWEVAMLAAHRRIELDRDPLLWMEQSLRDQAIEVLPLTPAVAVISSQLDSLHGDPADRLIVATALSVGASLVTRDEKIRDAGILKTVW